MVGEYNDRITQFCYAGVKFLLITKLHVNSNVFHFM